MSYFRITKKLIVKINYKIIDQKLLYDINREVTQVSALSSVKIDKNQYLT